MSLRLLIGALVCWTAVGWAAEPSPSPPPEAPKLAPFKERLAAAEKVRVETSILGLTLDSTLAEAHAKLDPLGNPSQPAQEKAKESEGAETEHKVLWKLTKSDYSSVLIKADEKERVVYITGFLRPGKEIPFARIGEVEKAPLASDRAVAWDVVRPPQPLIRVVARGEKRKAHTITLFVVKRLSAP